MIRYIEPDKTNQIAYFERSNRSYRTKVADPHLFSSLEPVRELSWAWILSFKEELSYQALRNLTFSEFKQQLTAEGSSYELCA